MPQVTMRPKPQEVFKVRTKAAKNQSGHNQPGAAKGKRSSRMRDRKGH
jgi:hypothetical protein